jgi:hypothetical protein
VPSTSGPTTIAIGIAATIAVIPFVVIAAVNVFMVFRRWTPLTQLVEHYMRRYPWFAAGICGFVGALVGHIFWSFGDNPAKPVGHSNLLLIAIGIAVGAGVVGAVMLAAIAYAAAWLFGRFRSGAAMTG